MLTQIDLFDSRFRSLHERSITAVATMPTGRLFERPESGGSSFGDYLLRSVGAVEQTFGGITARLWDDPFEWTLPEELSTNSKLIQYLDDVEATRRKGFGFFKSDADLAKQIPAPERLRSIFDLLLETIARAEHFQGRALVVFSQATGAQPPRF